MPAKPRWSDIERERLAVPSFLVEIQSSESSTSQPGSTWGAWHVLDSTQSRMDAAIMTDTIRTSTTNASSSRDADSPFVFSIDDVTLRSGVAVMEFMPTTRRLPPPVRDLDLVRLMMHGSLRLGGHVSFWSGKYVGYAVCAVCYALTTAAIEATVEWLSPHALGLDSFRELKGLLHLEWTVVLPIGLMSDAFAPFGYHRKSFMIIGWSVLAVVWAAQFVAFQFRSSLFASEMPPPSFSFVLAVVAMLALAMVNIPLTVRMLELSQHEELSCRGGVVAMYLLFTLVPQLFVRAVVFLQSALTPTPARPSSHSSSGNREASGEDKRLDLVVSLPLASVALLLVALVPIPFLAVFAHETQSASSSSRPIMASLRWHTAAKRLGDAFHRLWSAANSKAVSDVVIMNGVLFFFARLDYTGAERAVSAWCGETLDYMLLRAVVLDAAMVTAVILWRRLLVNASWVSSVIVAALVWKLSAIMSTALVAFGALREPWVPSVATLGLAPAKVALWLAGMLPTLEVVQPGNEGAVYGLVVSYQLLAQLLGDQIVSGIQSTGALVTPGRSIEDTAANTSRVVIGAVVLAVISLLSLLAVCFLPRQKLEAQQRRLLGGYSESRRLGLAVGLAVLYALVAALQLVHNAQSDRFE